MRFKKIAAFILILFVTGFVGYGVSNQRIAPSFQAKETIKPIIDIPTSILKQERSEFINLWGVPVNEDYNIGTAEEVLTYYTPDFKLKIKFFTGTPIEIDVIPLKEYKISM
ncbi:hypothetical protein [Desulfolucanica intricata]|uniref:hypothetical protein n=1 Tax=Desulfolucanica intricata TaxID=1285191 RepID=UPI000829E60C|nr:hypothetical protein [Desulfolucanica intricata]